MGSQTSHCCCSHEDKFSLRCFFSFCLPCLKDSVDQYPSDDLRRISKKHRVSTMSFNQDEPTSSSSSSSSTQMCIPSRIHRYPPLIQKNFKRLVHAPHRKTKFSSSNSGRVNHSKANWGSWVGWGSWGNSLARRYEQGKSLAFGPFQRFKKDKGIIDLEREIEIISSDDEEIEILSNGEEEGGQSELLDQRSLEDDALMQGTSANVTSYRYPASSSSVVSGSSNRGLKVEEDVAKIFESMSVHNEVEDINLNVEKLSLAKFLSVEEEERGQSELLDQRYCEGANVTSYRYRASSSSSVVSGSSNRGLKVEDVGKISESMSVHNGVEEERGHSDSSVEKIEILSDGEEESGQSDLLDQRYCEGANVTSHRYPASSSWVVSGSSNRGLNVGKMSESMSVHNGVEDINLNVEKLSLAKIFSDEEEERGQSEFLDQRYLEGANVTSYLYPAWPFSLVFGSSNRGLKVEEDVGKMSMSVHNGVEEERGQSDSSVGKIEILSDGEEERGQSDLLDQRYCEGANVTSHRYPASSSSVVSGSSNRGLKVEDVGKMSESMSVHNGVEEERGQSDSSVEKIEILSDGEEERGQSELLGHRYCEDANVTSYRYPASSSSVVSGSSNWGLNVEDVGKKLESMSIQNGVEDLVLLPHQKLLKSSEKQNSRWNELVDIKLNVEISLASKPAKKPNKEIFKELFCVLTKEEYADVTAAFSSSNRRETLVTHQASNIEITGEILQCLRPKGWLNDEVINLYLELLKEREEREPNKFLKCHFFNTFFYRKLINGSHEYDFKAIRRWTTPKKIGYGLIECDKIFVPIHKPSHWCLAVINRKDKKFQYLDSLKGMDAQVLEVLARYYVDEVKDKSAQDIDVSSWEYENVHDLPKQENGFDCGMFLIKYTDFYSRGLTLSFEQKHMPYFRRRTAKEILKLKAE